MHCGRETHCNLFKFRFQHIQLHIHLHHIMTLQIAPIPFFDDLWYEQQATWNEKMQAGDKNRNEKKKKANWILLWLKK